MKTKLLTLTTSLFALSTLPAAVGQEVGAQASAESSATTTRTLDTVTVTARRREEALTDIPMNLTAFSSDDLEKKGIVTTADLAKVTPGIVITGAGSRVNPFIVMRGASRALAGPGVPGVITYMNEVPLPAQGSIISSLDMDNIQVLKGPQGTLFGRNAVGGALLTYTKKPTYDYEGSLFYDFADYNTTRSEAVINIPLIEDKLAFRLAAQSGRSDGFVETLSFDPRTVDGLNVTPDITPTEGDNIDSYENQTFRGSLLFEPTDRISNLTVVDYTYDKGATNSGAVFVNAPVLQGLRGRFTGGIAQLQAAIANPATPAAALPALQAQLGGTQATLAAFDNQFFCTTSVYCNIAEYAALEESFGAYKQGTATPHELAKTEIFGVANTTTFEINDAATLKNIFGYRTNDTLSIADIDGTPMAIVDTASRTQLRQITEELQLSGDLFGDKLQYVLGGFYYKQEPRGDGGFQGLRIDVFGGVSANTSVSYPEHTSKSLYGQFDYDLSDVLLDGLTVTAGYRHTWDEVEACTAVGFYNPFTPVPDGGNLGDIPSEDECKAGNFAGDDFAASPAPFGSSIPPVKDDQGTYTLALSWEPSSDQLYYITHRRGYRAGDINSPFYAGDLSFLSPIQGFDGEIVTDVEIGAKLGFDLSGVPASLEAAVFQTKSEGFQFYESTTGIVTPTDPNDSVPDGVSLPLGGIVFNKADLDIEGYELSGTISPIPDLVLGANVSYTDVSVDKLTIPQVLLDATAGARDLRTGFSIPFITEWQYNASVSYTFPFEVLGGSLNWNTDYHYQDEWVNTQVVVPSYSLVNTRFTLSDVGGNPVDLSIYANNLLDEEYYYGTAGSSPLTTGAGSFIVGPPRMIGASLRVKFGG